MEPFETQYIQNVREIAALRDLGTADGTTFEAWYEKRLSSDARISELKAENMSLLNRSLFPILDDLHNASAETVASLEAFAEQLMDWSTNLDCGVYILIHDALLSLYRVRRDRGGIIKELYKLGMGLFYQNRSIEGVERKHSAPFHFQNEMVFTEAGSYLKFFDQVEDETTKGFIIRALANIAICAKDTRRRVAVSARILRIVRDEYYRNLAPGLPWDVFLRRTQQQMSANRDVLSKGDLSTEDLAAVLDACHAVFEPEANTDNPNIRWLWPYYEMEYSCGFVDLKTTLERMERLIRSIPYDQYDASGLYANVQLPIYYGRLLRDNPSVRTKARYLQFLSEAYEKMMRTMMTLPQDRQDDFFVYNLNLVVTDYFETDGVPPYEEIALKLMRRFAGMHYADALRTGALLKTLCRFIDRSDPSFFSDLDFLRDAPDAETRSAALADYAEKCGMFCDFGLIKMNFDRLVRTRSLFDPEFALYQLHAVSGHDDLAARKSTARYADVALGHHRWYNGAAGYPESYVRNESRYRQMTDVAAVAVYLIDRADEDPNAAILEAISLGGKRFSPLVTAFLDDPECRAELLQVLTADRERYYRAVFEQLS